MTVQDTEPEGAAGQQAGAPADGRTAYRDLALYILLRLAAVVVVAAVLALLNVPLLIALAVGLVLGFPLSMLVFRRLGAQVAEGLSAKGAAREAERQRLRAQLRGEPLE